jgi:hypothetical protein
MNVAGFKASFAWVGIQPLAKAGANLWREPANIQGGLSVHAFAGMTAGGDQQVQRASACLSKQILHFKGYCLTG